MAMHRQQQQIQHCLLALALLPPLSTVGSESAPATPAFHMLEMAAATTIHSPLTCVMASILAVMQIRNSRNNILSEAIHYIDATAVAIHTLYEYIQ
jgi:hypothetical protein